MPRTPAEVAALAGDLLRSGAQQLALAQDLLAVLAAQQLAGQGQAPGSALVAMPAAAAVAPPAAPPAAPRQGSRISYVTLSNVGVKVAPANAQRFLLYLVAGGFGTTSVVSFDPITTPATQGIQLNTGVPLILTADWYGDIVTREWYGAVPGASGTMLVMEGFFL